MRTAADSLKSPEAKLFGLDTFTGLPDGWVPAYGNRGRINSVRKPGEMTVGSAPEFDDQRIVLVRGLFQDTLTQILPGLGTRRLVINIDSDTYTAALFALTSLHPFYKQGDIIYFDEFADELNEFAAFNDYIRSYYMKGRFKLVGRAYDGFLFQFV